MPPLICLSGLARVWRFTIITCSTRTRFSSGNTRSTLPCRPLSRPEITFTKSFFLMSGIKLQHLRSQGDDLQEAPVAQLARHRPEDAGADGLASLVDEHAGVLVEADVGAVAAARLLAGADDHHPHHLAFLDLALGRRFLDGGGHHVAEPGAQA